MDPTQVDARYQIQFLPLGGGMIIDDFPVSTGPYTVPILLINNGGGLRVDDFQAVNTILASLTQQGVIGTMGGQQLQGPFFLFGTGTPGIGPPWGAFTPSAVMQDGILAFYNSNEGTLPDYNASLEWATPISFMPTLTLHSEYQLELHGGGVAGAVKMMHDLTGDFLQFDPLFPNPCIQTGGPFHVTADVPNVDVTVYYDSVATRGILDVSNTGSGNSRISLDSNQGADGVDAIGNEFYGGINLAVGTGPLSWSSITGTPTTFSGYGLTTPMLPGDTAGGDLDGTYPNPGVASIQGFPLAISGPISGDVLTWGGLSWVAAPGGGGGGLAIGNPVGGGAGNRVLLEDPAANLADSPQVVWDATNGMLVNDGATCSSRLAQFGVAASFDDGINNARMCDGTWAIQVTSGAIKLAGGTLDFPNSHVPPLSTQPVPAPSSAYGQGAIVNYLGDPDVWVQVTLAGTQYCLPLYLP